MQEGHLPHVFAENGRPRRNLNLRLFCMRPTANEVKMRSEHGQMESKRSDRGRAKRCDDLAQPCYSSGFFRGLFRVCVCVCHVGIHIAPHTAIPAVSMRTLQMHPYCIHDTGPKMGQTPIPWFVSEKYWKHTNTPQYTNILCTLGFTVWFVKWPFGYLH